MPLEIRAVGRDELDRVLLTDSRTFGGPVDRGDASLSWAEGELDRTRVAFEGDEIVGASRSYSFELTMPGGALLPAAAVSWVGVLPTHRRRGVLTQMMAALHDDARAHDEPVAMLTASESAIYGRFGYGVATWRLGLTAERARIEFRDPAVSGRMRMVTREEGQKVLPALYDRLRLPRAGMVSRPDFWWPSVFWDQFGGKGKAFFVVVHSDDEGNDDGYLAYEISGGWNGGLPDRRLLIWDFQAAGAAAHAALWQYTFGVDLIGTVAATSLAVDDPLRLLVVDGRRVRVDFVNDGLWIAALAPERLLAARTYSVPGRLVLQIQAPDGRAHTYALEGGEDGAECTASTAPPDLTCSTATLGMGALGGNRWTDLAHAGLVDARDEATLRRADLMFTATPAPAMLSFF